MDVKDLQSEATIGDRSNDGSKYSSNSITLPYSRNKSYQDVNSVSLGKVDAPIARPCAVIGPDRVLPPLVSADTIKKSAFEAWCADNVYRHPPENPHNMTNYNTPIRNISPRQTFQENMQRIMVPPTYNSMKGNEEYNSHIDKNISMTKNTKPNIPIETKYCEVPYSGNSILNEQKSVRNNELSASNVNPVLARSAPQGWPSHLRQSRPYGAPELFQYPDYANCAGPRPVPMVRSHRSAHEDLGHGYADPYGHDVRYKPYPVKDRYPQARYEFISNYPGPFHPPPAYPPHKYDMQKPVPQPYTYQQLPLKYLDNRIPDNVIDGYQRPTQQNNYNLPFHNQMIHPAYGPPIVGNCVQNKFPESSVKCAAPNKQPYESNKMYTEYENGRPKAFPENYYFNEMHRPPPHIKSQVMPNYSLNMQRFPPHPYYTKDNLPLKTYEYAPHFRNVDPSIFTQSRIPSQFSPNGITVSPLDPSHNLDNPQIQASSQEDYGYVSQSPTGNMRNTDFVINRSTNELYRRYDARYGHPGRPAMLAKHDQNSNDISKDKKDINVRQFLQMWSEVDDENGDNTSKEPVSLFPNDVNKTTNQYETVDNQDQLYVLGLVNVPSEELSKYEHIQKVSKLPENIKGYNSIELLNQFEEVIESSNINNFKSKSITSKDTSYQMPMKNSGSHISMLPRPVSPLDVEAKISQSVIHKEVGCNFEIKPCSPKMLNVEAATPIQNLLGERVIEKVSNTLIINSPLMHSEDKLNCNVLKQHEPHKSPNENVKNTSCKMSNTQFNNNNTERTNYSLQDLESNSGICLASLPRLDNDIELNFPEVNQQFINANKGESVITATKDLPSLNMDHIDKINAIKQDDSICHKSDSSSESSPVIDSESKFSKLSKYRKIKKYGPETTSQNMRTDSVIIKNPDNTKIFEQNKDIETPFVCIKKIQNNNKIVDSDPDKELSNKLGNAEKYNHTDIAIDFSLNKNDNNNTMSSTLLDFFVESENKVDSSKVTNSIKHLETSQCTELLEDQPIEHDSKIKSMKSKDETVLGVKRKDDMLEKKCNSDPEEHEISHTVTPEFSEFEMCENPDDMSLAKCSNIKNSNEIMMYEIKEKEGTAIVKCEENDAKRLDSTSVPDPVADYVSECNNTNSQIIEGSDITQFDDKRHLELPDLNIETTIPTTLTMCQQDENKHIEEKLSQKNSKEDKNVIITDRCDSSNLDEENQTVNDTDSVTAIQPNQSANHAEKFNESKTCSDANENLNKEKSFTNETELIPDELDIKLCRSDEKYQISENESNELSKINEYNNKVESLLENNDGNTIQNDILRHQIDSNLIHGEEHTEKKDIVSSQTNKTLQLVKENHDGMSVTPAETDRTQELLQEDESLEDEPLSSLNNSEEMKSNKDVAEDVESSDFLTGNIPLPEPQPITSLKLDDSQLNPTVPFNSNDESYIFDDSSKNMNPSVKTEYEISQQITNHINKEDSNTTSHTYLDRTNNEDNIQNINAVNAYLNENIETNEFCKQTIASGSNTVRETVTDKKLYSNHGMECEYNVSHTKSFLSCQLKKELFSPFIRKLISQNEGPLNPQIRQCSLNLENKEPAQIKLIDHSVDFNQSKSSNENTCDEYIDNDTSISNVKDNVDNSFIEKCNAISENKRIGSSTDSFVDKLFFAAGTENSNKCSNSTVDFSSECIKVNETFTTSSTVIEPSGNNPTVELSNEYLNIKEIFTNSSTVLELSGNISKDELSSECIKAKEMFSNSATVVEFTGNNSTHELSSECIKVKETYTSCSNVDELPGNNSTDELSSECIKVKETFTNNSTVSELSENNSTDELSSDCIKVKESFTNSSTDVSSENKDDGRLSSSDSISIDNMDCHLDRDNNDLKESEDNSGDPELILTINEEIITNSDPNIECALNKEKSMLQNKQAYTDCNRPRLKRSLSDSALNSFTDSNDTFYSERRSKRPKNEICNLNIDSDLLDCSHNQNIRRKSISSVYNEQNVSFCILIDNNCIITEENEDQGEICIAEVSEDCLTDLQEPVSEYDNIFTPQPPDPPEECIHDYSETQEVEESWVDDVACMETVVSDDVAEDITISASSSPERMQSLENDESGVFMNSEHTDKVKHIYGAKMCNDDIMFLETLYRTPQMNVNKIINGESQVSEEYIRYYNKDSLEKVLSEPSCHKELRPGLETFESLNSFNPLDDEENIEQDENLIKDALPIGESSPVCDIYNESESNYFQYNENLLVPIDKTQDDTVHSCESSIDNVFSYNQKDEYKSYTSSTSPEVSSTTSEERNSSLLLKITNYKGSRVSQVNDLEKETKSISCKFTELNDYSSSQNFKTNRPLITKAAQKYIPPLEETLSDLKIRLPLPQHSLLRLKQLKLLKNEPKSNKCNIKSKPDVPKKPRPKFEDVLKSIDEIQFKMHKEKSKKSKKTIPKVVIKKNENGSHYASTTNKPFNPDLTGRKWQPWVFLEKNNFVDKMALRNKRKAIFNHRKNTYVLADKFRKYKSIGNAKFVISQPNLHSSPLGHLKCTIRLKHTY